MAPIPLHRASDAEAGRSPNHVRSVVLWLAWIETALLVIGAGALLAASGRDPVERSTLGVFLVMAIVYWLVIILPALLLARWNRLPILALALLLVPPALIGLLFVGF